MTDTKTEYAALAQKIATKGRVKTLGSDFFFTTQECERLYDAVRLADALERGPSLEMLNAAPDEWFYTLAWDRKKPRSFTDHKEGIFQAMIQQLKKEISDEQL